MEQFGVTTTTVCVNRSASLVIGVLGHRELSRARGTLLIPLWKSSDLWNVCSTDGVSSNNFFID